MLIFFFFLKAQLSRHSSGSFKPCILSSGLAIDKRALTKGKKLVIFIQTKEEIIPVDPLWYFTSVMVLMVRKVLTVLLETFQKKTQK